MSGENWAVGDKKDSAKFDLKRMQLGITHAGKSISEIVQIYNDT